MPLRKNLIRLMKQQHLTIEQLAQKTGISVPTLKKLRSRQPQNPTLDTLIRIGDALQVTLDALVMMPNERPCVVQTDDMLLPDPLCEFTFVFTHTTFGFKTGTRAIFTPYKIGDPITPIIFLREGSLLQRVKDTELTSYHYFVSRKVQSVRL